MRQLSINLTGECVDDALSAAHSDTVYVSFSGLTPRSGAAAAAAAAGRDDATSSCGCTAIRIWTHKELFILRYVLALTAMVLTLGSIYMGITQHYHGRVCFSSRQPPSELAVVASCEVYQNHSYASMGGAPDVKIEERSSMETPLSSHDSLSSAWPLDIDSSSRTTGAHAMTFTGGWPLENSVMHLVVSVLLALLLIFLRALPTTMLPVGMWVLVAVALAATILFGTWSDVVGVLMGYVCGAEPRVLVLCVRQTL